MKKIIALLLCLLMIVGMVACATNTDNNDQTVGPQTRAAPTTGIRESSVMTTPHRTAPRISSIQNIKPPSAP